MYVYEGHMGSLFATDHELSIEERYCEQCGDYDWCVGCATTRAEAWELLKNSTNTFDLSMCEGCPHDGDDDYCDDECEHFAHSGGWDYDYVQEFIKENWDE